jgi:hypothetical protein
MLTALKSALVAAAVAGLAGAAQAAQSSAPVARFDVRTAQGWAEKLVLCDVTAFLATDPDFNANRMWVIRDDGRRDLLLPPDFVGAGRWYKDGYQRLYFRLKRQGKIRERALLDAQNTVGHDFVEAYRRAGRGNGDAGFFRAQDSYCRAMARAEGEIIS